MNEIYKILEKYWTENKIVLSSFFDSPLEYESLEAFEGMGLYLRKNYYENEEDPTTQKIKKDFLIENSKALEDKYFEIGTLPEELGPLLLIFSNVSNTLYVWMYLTAHKQPEDYINEYSKLLILLMNKLKLQK
jgi:hypothetical protein